MSSEIRVMIIDPTKRSHNYQQLMLRDDAREFVPGVLSNAVSAEAVWIRSVNNLRVAYGYRANKNHQDCVTILNSAWLDGAPDYRARTFVGPIALYGEEDQEEGTPFLRDCPISHEWIWPRLIFSKIDAEV
jgi:hypothetical protein